MIIIRIWFSFRWQAAACTRTATKILVRTLGKKQSALRWPVVKKINATSTTTLPRLPSLQRFPPRLIALLREKSWERPLYWQLAFHCSFKYSKLFFGRYHLEISLQRLIYCTVFKKTAWSMHKLSWIFWELIVKPKKLKVTKLISQVIFYIGSPSEFLLPPIAKKAIITRQPSIKKTARKKTTRKYGLKLS